MKIHGPKNFCQSVSETPTKRRKRKKNTKVIAEPFALLAKAKRKKKARKAILKLFALYANATKDNLPNKATHVTLQNVNMKTLKEFKQML